MSGKNDTWMPLYIGDYLADTQHLSTVEHGAYLLLLMTYWRIKGPLPDDDLKLSRMVRLPLKQWKSIRSTVIEFFQIVDGQLVSSRAEKEIEAARIKSAKASANALKRHNQNDADAMPPQSERNATLDANDLLSRARQRASPSPSPSSASLKLKNPLPTEERAPAKKRTGARRHFEPEEPIDPDFYAMAVEEGINDPLAEWVKFRDWHTVNCRPTGNAKGSFRTWINKALAMQPKRFAVVK